MANLTFKRAAKNVMLYQSTTKNISETNEEKERLQNVGALCLQYLSHGIAIIRWLCPRSATEETDYDRVCPQIGSNSVYHPIRCQCAVWSQPLLEGRSSRYFIVIINKIVNYYDLIENLV